MAVLAALLPGCAMSWFVAAFACSDTCSTPAYYFAQLAPREALFMLPCVALAVFAVAVPVPYCQATHQIGRALCVFLFFLLGGLFGVAALYGLAQLALAILSPTRIARMSTKKRLIGCGVDRRPYARRRRLVGELGEPVMVH